MSPDVDALQQVGSILQSMASEPRQEQLASEMASIQLRVGQLLEKTTGRVDELKTADDKWSGFYSEMTTYSDWLAEKEAELQSIQNSDLPPDEQYRQTQLVLEEIMEKNATLQQLEQEGGQLSQGFRSRETASVKSKIASVRRIYDKLSQTAQKETEILSDDVTHWNEYQGDMQQLMPFIADTEKVLAEDDGKVASLEDALQQYEMLQVSYW